MCCMIPSIKQFKNKQNTPLGRMEWGEVRNGADGVLVILSFFTSIVITFWAILLMVYAFFKIYLTLQLKVFFLMNSAKSAWG